MEIMLCTHWTTRNSHFRTKRTILHNVIAQYTPFLFYTLRFSYAVAVALACPVSAAFSFGMLIFIASSLTLAGPRSCPLGTPGTLEFLLFPLAPGPVTIFFWPG